VHANVPSDIIVESSIPGDPLLADIAHLVLELSSNGNIVENIDLVSREINSGVWDTEQALVM
jgi:hypothetical protein